VISPGIINTVVLHHVTDENMLKNYKNNKTRIGGNIPAPGLACGQHDPLCLHNTAQRADPGNGCHADAARILSAISAPERLVVGLDSLA
jgi:hypothetical protein